jgi:adenosylcobinamide-GDP ribazoletransferase
VGLFLGVILAGLAFLFLILGMSKFLSGVLLIVCYTVLTGGLHLDGLADSCDALFSGKSKDVMLAIMKDSHIGVMGTLGLISVFLLKVGLLMSLPAATLFPALLLMPVISRLSIVLLFKQFPYARDEGKAKMFFDGFTWTQAFIAFLIASILAVFLPPASGVVALLVVLPMTTLWGTYATKKLGGITGDVGGAMNEIAEVVVLLVMGMGKG